MNKRLFNKFKKALDNKEYDHVAHNGESISIGGNGAVHFDINSLYQFQGGQTWRITKEFYLININGKSYDGDGNPLDISKYGKLVNE